jgi:hypothetical protein
MVQHKNYLWDCILYHIYCYTIYSYFCNQCLSPLALWVWIPFRWGVLDTTLSDKVSQWLSADRWFSTGTPISSINKTDCLDIIEILLKVVLNTITLTSLCQYMHLIYSLLHKTHLYASICTSYTLYYIKPTSIQVRVYPLYTLYNLIWVEFVYMFPHISPLTIVILFF